MRVLRQVLYSTLGWSCLGLFLGQPCQVFLAESELFVRLLLYAKVGFDLVIFGLFIAWYFPQDYLLDLVSRLYRG